MSWPVTPPMGCLLLLLLLAPVWRGTRAFAID